MLHGQFCQLENKQEACSLCCSLKARGEQHSLPFPQAGSHWLPPHCCSPFLTCHPLYYCAKAGEYQGTGHQHITPVSMKTQPKGNEGHFWTCWGNWHSWAVLGPCCRQAPWCSHKARPVRCSQNMWGQIPAQPLDSDVGPVTQSFELVGGVQCTQ